MVSAPAIIVDGVCKIPQYFTYRNKVLKVLRIFDFLRTKLEPNYKSHRVGGESEDTLDDPVALNALNNFMIQLMDHALENGCFDNATERIVIGEIEHIEMQVIYLISILLVFVLFTSTLVISTFNLH